MKQNYKLMMIIVALTVLATPLWGCGVKPGKVQPPAGAESSQFPRTYPKP